MNSSSSRPTKVKDLDLEYFLLRVLFITHLFRLLDFTLYQEVPKLFSQQQLHGLVDKTTAQQPKIQQFETDARRENFLLKFLDLIIHNEVPKLKSFPKQDVVDKVTAQQLKVQQLESTGFQDPQEAAETSSN